jgi:hypothetical protein
MPKKRLVIQETDEEFRVGFYQTHMGVDPTLRDFFWLRGAFRKDDGGTFDDAESYALKLVSRFPDKYTFAVTEGQT